MWQLLTNEDGKRTYTNSVTGSRCTTTMCYQDREGNDWHSFDDLMSLPYTRSFAATKISSLYALGLSKEDLNGHISAMKSILKSGDPERYEKAYANVLDFEAKANQATDAIKQMSSLVCVYYMLNDEPIDSWDNNLQLRKMQILEADIDAHTFFLQKQVTDMEDYTNHLRLLTQIASQPLQGL